MNKSILLRNNKAQLAIPVTIKAYNQLVCHNKSLIATKSKCQKYKFGV